MANYLKQRPGRSGWYFQRAVPKYIQEAVGKKVWLIKAGDSLKTARVAAIRLMGDTEKAIATARDEGYEPRTPTREMQRLEPESWLRGKSKEEILGTKEWDVYSTMLPSEPAQITKILRQT